MPSSGGQSGGVKFNQVVKIAETGEKPIAFFAVKDEEMPAGKLFFYTASGMVRLSPWSEFKVAKTSFQAIKLKDKDEVIGVEEEIPNGEFFFATELGMCVHCHDTFPEYGRVSGGVKGVDVADGDRLITAMQIEENKEYDVVVATSFGTFKKVLLDTLGKLPRARKGIKIADLGREGKEKVLLAEAVADDSEIYLAIEDEEGNMYHSVSGEVPLESRMGKGKMLPSVGIIKSKGVYSFRIKGQK